MYSEDNPCFDCDEPHLSNCEGCSDTGFGCDGDDDECCGGKMYARTPYTKIVDCKTPRVKVAQVIPARYVCADRCATSPTPVVPTPTDCTGQPTSPVWVKNGQTTTIGCDIFNEEVDTNLCSPTHGTKRLVDAVVINVVLNCN